MAIKRNYLGIDVIFARDERKERDYYDYGSWWNKYPYIYGYKDVEKGGTWFAHNNSLFACILNQEYVTQEHYLSRGSIIIELLSHCDNVNSAKNYCKEKDFSRVLPFTMVIIDNNKRIALVSKKAEISTGVIQDVDNSFFMLNRSYKNDFSQRRI